jgi:hypothetical protein
MTFVHFAPTPGVEEVLPPRIFDAVPDSMVRWQQRLAAMPSLKFCRWPDTIYSLVRALCDRNVNRFRNDKSKRRKSTLRES